MASSKIVDLRKMLAERFASAPASPSAILSTGVKTLDDHIGGGLPKGGITEITSAHSSSGTATLIAALLHKAHRDRYFVAVIDARDSFDPQSVANPALQHLLWVRCNDAGHAVRSADLLLRDGNFPIVVLDLILNASSELRGIPQTTWYRLQRLVEKIPTAFLVLSRDSIVASAQLKLALKSRWTLGDIVRENNTDQFAISLRRSHGAFSGQQAQLAS